MGQNSSKTPSSDAEAEAKAFFEGSQTMSEFQSTLISYNEICSLDFLKGDLELHPFLSCTASSEFSPESFSNFVPHLSFLTQNFYEPLSPPELSLLFSCIANTLPHISKPSPELLQPILNRLSLYPVQKSYVADFYFLYAEAFRCLYNYCFLAHSHSLLEPSQIQSITSSLDPFFSVVSALSREPLNSLLSVSLFLLSQYQSFKTLNSLCSVVLNENPMCLSRIDFVEAVISHGLSGVKCIALLSNNFSKVVTNVVLHKDRSRVFKIIKNSNFWKIMDDLKVVLLPDTLAIVLKLTLDFEDFDHLPFCNYLDNIFLPELQKHKSLSSSIESAVYKNSVFYYLDVVTLLKNSNSKLLKQEVVVEISRLFWCLADDFQTLQSQH
ncbi:hypothetical protein GEMRC1_012500 [Eukaryota sp. GEM-RC1]